MLIMHLLVQTKTVTRRVSMSYSDAQATARRHAFSVSCRIDPLTEASVLTVGGASRREAQLVLSRVGNATPDEVTTVGLERVSVLSWEETVVLARYYRGPGGVVELMSHNLTCEGLLALLPREMLEETAA